MKATGMFFLLLLMACFSHALSINTERTEFEQGEKIVFTLECRGLKEYVFLVQQGKLELANHSFKCPAASERYEFALEADFLFPAGTWTAELSSNTEKTMKKISVMEKRESGFLLVRFLSPSGTEFYRGEKIVISIEVRDDGNEVFDANAVFFGTNGKRFFLQKVNNGAYNAEYTIPIDAEIGKWRLNVYAQKKNNNKIIGGHADILMEIKNAPIELKVLSPQVNYFDAGQKVDFLVNAKYLDGTVPQNAVIKAAFGSQQIVLIEQENGAFVGTAELMESDAGTFQAIISAVDQYGNSSSTQVNITVGCSLTCIVTRYGLIVIASIVGIAAVSRIVFSKLSYKNELKNLEEEKKRTLELIKSLQSEYFSKGVMPASSYKSSLSEYKEKIAELEKRIENLKKNEKD